MGWLDDFFSMNQYGPLAEKQAYEGTAANRPDQSNPFGYSSWARDANGRWQQDVGFSPALQAQFNQLTSQSLDPTAARQKAYESEMAQINPAFNTQQSQLGAQLSAQGLDPNSEAARGQMAQLAHQREGARQGAITNSYTLGNQDIQNTLMGLNTMRGLMQPFGFMGGQGPNYLGAQQMQDKHDADVMNGVGSLGASFFA